jgi:hypothetical protein
VRSPGGYVKASLDDYIGRTVLHFGDLDPKITWALGRIIRSGDQGLDIGANIGVLTLWMSKLVGAGGIVHALGPNPVLRHTLHEVRTHNGTDM